MENGGADKPYKDPVALIRRTGADGAFLFTDEECLRLLDVYIARRAEALFKAGRREKRDLAEINVRAVREKLGKNQRQMADWFSVSAAAWCKYEAGLIKPPVRILAALARMGEAALREGPAVSGA
jgi:DNA-binding XRE family transcriptional regulator